jgi:hypothetical protein
MAQLSGASAPARRRQRGPACALGPLERRSDRACLTAARLALVAAAYPGDSKLRRQSGDESGATGVHWLPPNALIRPWTLRKVVEYQWTPTLTGCHEGDENLAQQKPEPVDQATEVVADGGEDSVGSVAPTEPEIVSVHAMLGLEMADHRLDGGAAAQLAFDAGRHAAFLAGYEDPEL